MREAFRLTRAGDLSAAAVALRHALGGVRPAAADAAPGTPRVADVEARELPPRPMPREAPPDGGHPPEGRTVAGVSGLASGVRPYLLFVPPQYQGQALPLVVMLHGCKQDPADFAAGTGMNDEARRQGFFVLYPAQLQRANPARCWNWFKHNHQVRGRGEPASIAGLVGEVAQRYAIDADRVYVAGLSAGGAMAAIVGQAYPERFAAVGVHSGLPVGAAHDVSGAFAAMSHGAPAVALGPAPPTIVFHGDRDATVHPLNGEQVFRAAVGSADGGGAPEVERRNAPDGRPVTHSTQRHADGRPRAEHWLVHGAGHAWSGGQAAGSYTDVQGPSATREMLRFFFDNPRPAV